MDTKQCSKCGVEYPATSDYFHAARKNQDGLRPECKLCRQHETSRYREENRQTLREKQREYILKKPEASRIYRENHKDKISLDQHSYYERHRDEILQHKREEREIKRQETSRYIQLKEYSNSLSIDTHVLTPNGWTSVALIQEGDFVFDDNGCIVQVLHSGEIHLGNKCFDVIFSDGSIVTVDEHHSWFVWTNSSRNLQRKDLNTSANLTTTQDMVETMNYRKGKRPFYSVELAHPLQYPEQELPIDPYILGLWLGDGSAADSTITISDIEIADAIQALGYPIRKMKGLYQWTLSPGFKRDNKLESRFTTKLRQLQLLKNKHVPESYLRGSISQRLSLLMGLMDTDGTISENGQCNFDNTNRTLIDAVYQLIVSLGMKAKITSKIPTLNGKLCRMSFSVYFTPSIPVFRLTRKASRQRNVISRRQHFRVVSAINERDAVFVRSIHVDSQSKTFLVGKACIPTYAHLR